MILRDVIRDRRIPQSVRQILKIEAGMNDLVVLPVILVLIAVSLNEVGGTLGWLDFMARLLLLGPAIGFVIGGLGSWLMARVERAMADDRRTHTLGECVWETEEETQTGNPNRQNHRQAAEKRRAAS